MSEHIDNGASGQICPNDSREQLEADVREICRGNIEVRYLALEDYYNRSGLEEDTSGIMANQCGHLLFTVIVIPHMLDRQEAITRRECAEKCDGQNKHETIQQDELSDTRKQLEADILKKHNYMGPKPYSLVTTYDDVIGWLDRQAAISWDNAWKAQKDLIAEMQAEIDELTAKRDYYKNQCQYSVDQEQIWREGCEELQAKVDELTAERDSLRLDVAVFYDMCDECNLVASLTGERDQLKAECDKLKGRLENQAAYIDGVEDNLCRYELQLVRNEKDFDKLTAERDRLQATVDALRHDQENVKPAAADDRLTAVQAREIRTKSDGKWVQRTSERIIREFLYQVRERSEQGLSDYILNLSTYPSDEVRKTVLKELSELGYKYVRYHFWSKKRYIVYW